MSKSFTIDNRRLILTGKFDQYNEDFRVSTSSYYVVKDHQNEDALDMITTQSLSSEFDLLIRAAAKYTDRFASDILTDIQIASKIVKNPLSYMNDVLQNIDDKQYADTINLYRPSKIQQDNIVIPMLFGFRRDGVDGNAFIQARIATCDWDVTANGYSKDLDYYYRAIYLMEHHIKLDRKTRLPMIDVTTSFGRIH